MNTVTMRLAGSMLVINVGGEGDVVRSPEAVVDALLRNERVHVPERQAFRGRVRNVLARRSLEGKTGFA